MNRIKMISTGPETGPVERSDLIQGLEVDKGRCVVVAKPSPAKHHAAPAEKKRA